MAGPLLRMKNPVHTVLLAAVTAAAVLLLLAAVREMRPSAGVDPQSVLAQSVIASPPGVVVTDYDQPRPKGSLGYNAGISTTPPGESTPDIVDPVNKDLQDAVRMHTNPSDKTESVSAGGAADAGASPPVDLNPAPLKGTDSTDLPIDAVFLIPLTSTHFNFCRSLYTALMNDYPRPTLINWGKTFTNGQQARVNKIIGIDNVLHGLRDDQYAIIMDGFDVWYQLPYRDFIDHYLEYTRDNDHSFAVFGADKKCWPNDLDSPACKNVPKSTLPPDAFGPDTDNDSVISDPAKKFIHHRPRWLNSGNMVGPVGVLREVYDRANKLITNAPASMVFSDQMYIAEVYGQQDLSMTVDFTSEVFQTMTFSHADVIFVDDDTLTSPRKPKDQRRRYAFNRISGALPPILHFNGPKEAMDTWWSKMWWSVERENPAVKAKSQQVFETGGAYDTDGTFIPWNEVCKDIDVHKPSGVIAPR
ncbi:uncharacterized protein V2V93DRAFT_365658 [Kockiozyma suomiensis]|uniref:uncharacterized protein n=1 Tax=Kockiozyma suomiensis TaxID=1337062 RepID=UPI003343E982